MARSENKSLKHREKELGFMTALHPMIGQQVGQPDRLQGALQLVAGTPALRVIGRQRRVYAMVAEQAPTLVNTVEADKPGLFHSKHGPGNETDTHLHVSGSRVSWPF